MEKGDGFDDLPDIREPMTPAQVLAFERAATRAICRRITPRPPDLSVSNLEKWRRWENRQHWLRHQRFTWPPHLYRAVRDYSIWKMRGNCPLLPMTRRQMFGIRPKAAREDDGSAISPLHVDIIPEGVLAYVNLAGKTHIGFERQELAEMQDWSRHYWEKRWEPMRQCGEVMLANLCEMSSDEIGKIFPSIPKKYRERPDLLGTPLAGLPFGLLEHPEYEPPPPDEAQGSSGGSNGPPPPRPAPADF